MQEPVPKDLLSKAPEVSKYREVVQEKDVLLRNSKARILELEEQVADLDAKYRRLQEIQTNPQSGKILIEQYETFYSKIMSESQQIVDQKREAEAKLDELQIFCNDLLGKYEKAKEVIGQYDEVHAKLKTQLMEYEAIITSLTEEYNRLKECVGSRTGAADSQSGLQQQTKLKDLRIKGQMQRKCSKSMFEPLKGLDSN